MNDVPLKKCFENITVTWYAVVDGVTYGPKTLNGKREIPSYLKNEWHPGSFSSSEASLNYHFSKHGNEVGSSNIASYVLSAKNFRSNLRGSTSSNVSGSTSNVTRYRKNGKYIDIQGSKNTGKIVSYGTR